MHNEIATDLKPKFYVKFDINSGKILQMARTPIEQPPVDHIVVTVTDNEIVGEVMAGRMGVRKIGPLFDIESNTWDIGKKSTVLHIRELSTRLLQVRQDKNPANCDIVVNVFKEDKTISVTANIGIIKKNMNLADVNEIAKHDDTGLLNLYFTRKGDPDFLIASISVDPAILLRSKSLKYRLPEEITRYADLDNISIFTRPVFHHYGLIVQEKLIKTDLHLNKNQILQKCGRRDDSHITFVRQGKYLRISSFMNKGTEKLFNKPYYSFLVCEKNIDIPVGMFTIETAELFSSDSLDIPLDFEWPKEPLIVYRGKEIVASYLGDTYDTVNQH